MHNRHEDYAVTSIEHRSDQERVEAVRHGAPKPSISKLAYFSGDATNPTTRLRIRSLMESGVDVVGFTFRRTKFHRDFVPFWDNVHLGQSRDRHYLRRIFVNLGGLVQIIRNRRKLRDVEVLYARLFDAALLAMVTRWFFCRNAKLVYEFEDVQAIFFRHGPIGRTFRFLERRILSAVDLVVVASPGFAEGYLEPQQNYTGPVFLIENRIQLDEIPPKDAAPSPRASKWRDLQDRWVIGWFGTLRCEKSMQYLSEIAERMGDKVLIYTRGYPTETGLDAYKSLVNRHSNWIYEGEYTMPEDLEDLYGQVHFVWCMDFLDEGGNSELLLACRMYHGGYFGAVPLVTTTSRMAKHLAPHEIGFSIGDAVVDEVCDLLETMSWSRYEAEREKTLSKRDALFLEDGSTIRELLNTLAEPPKRR
ncbi:MAG: hypothetical protein AAFQ67_02580 [Pseudomonadota bacterium]